jgi:hypothetical protein
LTLLSPSPPSIHSLLHFRLLFYFAKPLPALDSKTRRGVKYFSLS